MQLRRLVLASCFVSVLVWAQWSEPLAARLDVDLGGAQNSGARIYLFKNDRPFRLEPVGAVLPLRSDLFYRDRVYRREADPAVLEVTAADQSHFFLLKPRASFRLPAGKYRIEVYRGHFYKPFVGEVELAAGAQRKMDIRLERWAAGEWLSGDDHIHLVRDREDDALFLSWLTAEDLSVGNFLQLQRQSDAAWQYGFGEGAEARAGTMRSIRSGHESRMEHFGHINLLGGDRIVRPLSAGDMYGNRAEFDAFPGMLFGLGRKVGAVNGYAHFNGSMRHSTLLMDLALGAIDFVEVFQFGVLKTAEWYELLNAGLKLTGVAGSDFPVALNNWTRQKVWSRWLPLLGPERYVVRRRRAGTSAFAEWAAGVRRGDGLVTNGPLVEVTVDGDVARAKASFYKPLSRVEMVVNGKVTQGAEVRLPATGPVWVAARVSAGVEEEGTPEIQAHTNPVYVRWDGAAPDREARRRLAERWREELEWYRGAASAGTLRFASGELRERFFTEGERALRVLSGGGRE